jgi:hypothetical protein
MHGDDIIKDLGKYRQLQSPKKEITEEVYWPYSNTNIGLPDLGTSNCYAIYVTCYF